MTSTGYAGREDRIVIDLDSFRDELADILPKSQHSKIDRILQLIDPADAVVYTVEIPASKVGIDTVEVYGLVIAVDANGDAASVEFPYGAEVAA